MAFMDMYTIFILLAAITSSLVFFRKNKASQFWYLFPLLLFAAFIVECTGIAMAYKGNNTTTLYNTFTVIQFVFYFWMFSCFIQNATVKTLLRHLLWIYPLMFFVNKCYVQTGEQFQFLSASIGSVLIVLCAVYYFYELFRAKKLVDLIREPTFWISSGLLFFNTCIFPLYGFVVFIESPSNTIVHHVLILVSLGNILLYSTFIIAFLCRIRISKFSS